MAEEAGLGEQALNKMAELALASQLDEAEKLQVQVKTDPSKLAQGKLDSLAIEGEGLVMQEGVRMDALEMHLSPIAVNPLKTVMP